MKEFRGKTAVVTGGGDGMGRAMALALAREGMNIVLADINETAMRNVAAEVATMNVASLCVQTDVSIEGDVEQLVDRTYEHFGAAHVLCNNAGVVGSLSTPLRQISSDVWRWVFSINVMGVVHGVNQFLPRMLEAGEPGHIVNTASMAGLSAGAGGGAYCASKHAVVSLSRSLRAETEDSALGVSVLCPGLVQTGLVESTRAIAATTGTTVSSGLDAGALDRVGDLVANGMDPTIVGDMVVNAIRQDRFYVITHPESESRLRDVYQHVFDDAASTRREFFPDWSDT